MTGTCFGIGRPAGLQDYPAAWWKENWNETTALLFVTRSVLRSEKLPNSASNFENVTRPPLLGSSQPLISAFDGQPDTFQICLGLQIEYLCRCRILSSFLYSKTCYTYSVRPVLNVWDNCQVARIKISVILSIL